MDVRFLEPEALPGHRDIALYGSREWLTIYKTHAPLPLRILGVWQNNQLLAYLPFQEVSRLTWKRLLPLYMDTTGGPYWLIPSATSYAEQARLKRELQQEIMRWISAHYHFATLYPLECDPRIDEKGWTVSVRATAIRELNQHLTLSHQAERKWRKAKNKGLRLQRTHSPQYFAEACRTVEMRHAITHSVIAAPILEKLRGALEQAGLVETWSVLDADGREVAYGVVALDPFCRTARLWYNVNSREALKLYASDFLYAELPEQYRGRFDYMDFCGTDHPSLIEFKEKWASRAEYRFALEYTRNAWLKTAFRIYSTRARWR